MKIKQITETTTAGAIATTETALGGTQSRGNPSIYGGKKVGTLFKGKKTSAPYANSINESAELSEAQLEEDDVIVVPGQGRSRKNGLVPHGQSRLDHEVEMARSDLFSAAKNAQQVYSMIKDVSEDEGLDGWVQEKIIKANDYLNTIREYLEGKQVQGVAEGTDNVDSLVTDTEAVMKKFKMDATQELTTQALKIVLGEREYKDRPGYYYSFIRQIIARSKQQGLAEGRLDELGNTDAGRKALRAVQKRGGDEITAWNKKPESGYSPTPTNAAKHFDASVSAGNRLYGHGPNTFRKDTVLARDAMRRYHKGEPITPKEVEIISKWYPGFKVEQQGKIREADQPPNDSLMSPMSEARAKADDKAEKAGKKVTKDLEYDMKHKGKDDNKAEKAGKKVAKDIEYDEKHKTNEAKKPDANKNGIPDYAEDGKGKNDLKKKKDKIDEGMMDNIKGMLVPKLMKLLGPDAEKIANAVKQATGGDFTPSKENAIRVVKALGIDKAAAQGQSQQMAEDRTAAIAGNWQGKLIQALYTLGLLGSAGTASALWHTVGGSWFATVGILLLMFAGTFFGTAPGQIGAMGNFGNKGTSTQKGLDDHGMPIRNTNVKESAKKKVKEGMEHKLKAARHTGKAHALSKQGYNCGYDDMEESRHYHEGFKEGLDECYGQMPIQGYVGETNNEVADMASYGAHTPQIADEGNAFTAALKKTPQGSKFTLGGKSFTDHSSIEESPFAFEAWDKELNAILEGKDVTEGMTVSISKGQQGTPDSVSVSAQDSEADQLLSIIKQSGLGLFGGDAGQPQGAQPMTVDGGEGPQAEIEVVDDHDDMLSLIRKMTGQGPAQSNGDYEEEGGEEMHGHEHGEEETCESCGGMMEEGHACGEAVEEDEMDDGEAVEEDESMDQREYEVAEEINPNNNDEAEEEQTDATRDAALATAAGKNFADTDAPLEEGGDGGEAGTDAIAADDAADEVNAEEEDLDESLANGADDTFESDIDFMTNVISGGLNKRKSTGQTTIPVVSTQVNRLGSPMKESTDLLTDWKKLSGIK